MKGCALNRPYLREQRKEIFLSTNMGAENIDKVFRKFEDSERPIDQKHKISYG